MNSRMLAKRLATIGSISCLISCGKGPKHLPQEDYRHGKAAFELLEMYEKTANSAADESASNEEATIRDPDLLTSLVNYSISISTRRVVGYEQSTQAVDEIAPVIKLCHDDAQQYFDAHTASTGTCRSEIDKFKAKYHLK